MKNMKISRPNKESVLIALGFFILSFLWIYFSDRVLLSILGSQDKLTSFQTYKGWFYVTLATVYIVYIVNREIKKKNKLIAILNNKNEWQNILISNIPNIEVVLFDSSSEAILMNGNDFIEKANGNDEKSLNKVLSFRNENYFIEYTSLKKDILSGNAVNLDFDDKTVNLKIKGHPVTDNEGNIIAGLLVYYNNKERVALLSELLDEKEKYDQLFKEYHNVNLELNRSYQELIVKNKALKASKERYQNFFMQSTDGIYRLDFDSPLDLNLSPEEQKRYIIEKGYLAECNPVFAKIYGKNNVEELLNQKISELHNIETVNLYFDLSEQLVLNNYKIQNIETKEILPDGTSQFNLNTMLGIIEDRKLTRIWGTKTNISQLKKYERELIAAKKAAEESDKLKSAFLANMSHEIRTPLNGIVGFADLLSQNDLTQQQKDKYIHIVKLSNEQLLRIIDDILDISKIDTGQITISTQKFSLNQLMTDIEAYLLQEIKKVNKNLKIKCIRHFEEGADFIDTDKERLYQVVTNLVNNAVKFTSEGRITFGYRLIDPTILEFFVTDTGIGIPKNMHESIFKQFQQGEDYLTKTYGGTGLGLSICKGIIELLDGEITVESEPGKGATFTFTIPYFRPNISS